MAAGGTERSLHPVLPIRRTDCKGRVSLLRFPQCSVSDTMYIRYMFNLGMHAFLPPLSIHKIIHARTPSATKLSTPEPFQNGPSPTHVRGQFARVPDAGCGPGLQRPGVQRRGAQAEYLLRTRCKGLGSTQAVPSSPVDTHRRTSGVPLGSPMRRKWERTREVLRRQTHPNRPQMSTTSRRSAPRPTARAARAIPRGSASAPPEGSRLPRLTGTAPTLPHLRRDWARPSTSAPGLCLASATPRRAALDRAGPSHSHLRKLGSPLAVCTGT